MRIGSVAMRALAALALTWAGHAAVALDIGFEAEASNLQFPWTPVAPVTGSQFPNSNYFWGGEAWLTAPLGEDASIRVSYDRDPILRNTAIAAVQFERGIAKISVGPLIGFLNSDPASISAGISASVRLQWPGVAYVSMRSDGGTAISILQPSADPQARTELSAGFYVPNAIVSGLISAKRFNELDSSGGLVTDTWTRYAMTVNVFKKNVPYTALLSLGYELRSKHYATLNSTDSLGAVVIGVDATAQLSGALKLLGGISTGAYVFGLDALKGRGPDNSTFLFTASLGMSVDTSAIKILPKAPVEKEEKPEKAAEEAPKPTDAAPTSAAPSEDTPTAPKPATKLALDAGVGIYYNNKITFPAPFGALAALFNLRGGAWGSIGYRLTPAFTLGAEVGFDYITMSSSGLTADLFDLPVYATASYKFGAITVEALAGLFVNGLAAEGARIAPFFDLDAGARIKLGSFYLEGSYVIGVGSKAIDLAGFGSIAASYPRFGLGYTYSFIKE